MMNDLEHIESNWRCLENFDNYKKSLSELSEREKELCKKYFTHFFRLIKDSIRVRFLPWTNDLLFFTIFLDQRTATYIAQMVMGCNISSPPEYFCNYHKKMINVRKFTNFVNKNSSNEAIMNIQNLPCINTSIVVVALITSGANI